MMKTASSSLTLDATTNTVLAPILFIILLASSSSTTSNNYHHLVSAQQTCDKNVDCVPGHAWAAIPNAESPTGCQCRCEDYYEGWRCESCIANTNPTCTGCRANEGDASWSYDQSKNKCSRPCTSFLDCNDRARAFGTVAPGQASVFPPLSNCVCVCRSSWRTTSEGNCIECPVMYDPTPLTGECARCGNGYTGDYPDGCVKPCLNSADCNSNADDVSGIWRGEVSECQCTCKDQWAQPDCGKCNYPYGTSPPELGGSCDRCADNRDQSTYPDCIGSCNITENCTAPENTERVTRAAGQCICSCRFAWEGANQSDCSICDLKKSVMRRGDCYPKTETEELTPTDSTTLSDTMSSTASETASPSISSSVSLSESVSLSSSSSTSVSSSTSSSQSVSDPLSVSITIPETQSTSESFSMELTKSKTIVVCFMHNCGNGTSDTFFSESSLRCICNCREDTFWDNETKCESCPFNFNSTIRPDMKQYLLDKQREEQQFQQQQQNIIDAGGTTTTEAPPSSPQEQVFDPQSNFTDFYFHDCDYCAFGFFNRTSLKEFPHNATCDCASHVLTEMSLQTAVGVPADVDDFIHAFSDDIKSYLNTKCFGIIDFFVFPYASVVDLGSNTIRTQLEVIALTPPQMALSRCLLKPAATACLLSSLTDPSKTPPPASPNGGSGGQLGPRPFCIPIKSLLNVTNATVPAGQDDACFVVHINPTVPDPEFPSNLLPREVPYSPCANITRLNCPNFEEFDVIPAPIPDYLWLILLIVGAALLLLAIIALCCWRYFPVFAAWRERKRKQKRDEILLAMKEEELEEQKMLQEQLLKDKDADCLVIEDADVSDVSSCSDDDEYRAKQEKMKQLKLNQEALGGNATENNINKVVGDPAAAAAASVSIDDSKEGDVYDDDDENNNNQNHEMDEEARLLEEQLGVSMIVDDFSPPKRADLQNLNKKDKRKKRSSREKKSNENIEDFTVEPDTFDDDQFLLGEEHNSSSGSRRLTKRELDRQAELLKQGQIEDDFTLPPTSLAAQRNDQDDDDNGGRFSPRTSSGKRARQMMMQTPARDGREIWESLASLPRINIDEI